MRHFKDNLLTNLLLLVLMMLVMDSCVRRPTEQLGAADRIMEDKPDSALKILSAVDTATMLGNDEDRATYYLLLAQAQYKSYLPMDAEDKLPYSINFFKDEGNKQMLARSYYYYGRSFIEHKNTEAAMAVMKKAEEAAEDIRDSLQLQKIYMSLCHLNGIIGCYDLKLEYAKKQIELCLKRNDTVRLVHGYAHASLAYYRLGHRDSSNAYLLRTLPLLGKVKDRDKAYILNNIANMYLRENDMAKAEYYARKAFDMGNINSIATLGDVYMLKGEDEKAKELWRKAASMSTADLRKEILKTYANYCSQRCDFREALVALNESYCLSDSLAKVSARKELVELQLRYDKSVEEARSYRYLFFSLALLMLLSIISLVCIYIIYKYKKNRKRTEDLMNLKEKQLQAAEEQISELEKCSAERIREVKALKQEIEQIQSMKAEHLGRGYAVFNKLMKHDFEGLYDTREWRPSFVDFCSMRYYDKVKRWRLIQSFTNGQLLYVFLWEVMGFTDKDVEQLLGITNATLRAAKSRLKNVLGD